MRSEELQILGVRYHAQGRQRFPDWDRVMSHPLAFDVPLTAYQLDQILRRPDGCVIAYHMMKRKLVGLDP